MKPTKEVKDFIVEQLNDFAKNNGVSYLAPMDLIADAFILNWFSDFTITDGGFGKIHINPDKQHAYSWYKYSDAFEYMKFPNMGGEFFINGEYEANNILFIFLKQENLITDLPPLFEDEKEYEAFMKFLSIEYNYTKTVNGVVDWHKAMTLLDVVKRLTLDKAKFNIRIIKEALYYRLMDGATRVSWDSLLQKHSFDPRQRSYSKK